MENKNCETLYCTPLTYNIELQLLQSEKNLKSGKKEILVENAQM